MPKTVEMREFERAQERGEVEMCLTLRACLGRAPERTDFDASTFLDSGEDISDRRPDLSGEYMFRQSLGCGGLQRPAPDFTAREYSNYTTR